MFRLLGMHPGPDVSVPAAASLTGCRPGRARGMLKELAFANLLTEHGPGRFVFHDLLRAYAAELVSTLDADADRRAAMHRLLDYYLRTSWAAEHVVHPTRAQPRLPPSVATAIRRHHARRAEESMRQLLEGARGDLRFYAGTPES